MNKINDEYIYEELTMAEFSDKFLNNIDFKTPTEYDLQDFDIEICVDTNNYKPLNYYIVKPQVNHYYTDGKLNGAENHIIVENGVEILIQNHPDFKRIDELMDVVDLNVNDGLYYANGRINHNTTSGGKALAFHCSGRLQASQVGKIKGKVHGVEQVVGIRTKVKVIKNRMGPPHRSAEFDILFDRGIDNESGWLAILKNYKQIDVSGSSYTWTDRETGELIKMSLKTFDSVLEKTPGLKEQMYKVICDCLIMKYKKKGDDSITDENEDEDDLVVDTNVDPEE